MDLTVRSLKGEPLLELNSILVERQGLDQERVNKIKELHLARLGLESQFSYVRLEDYKMLFEFWTDVQYQLQDAWGFKRDSNFHPSHRLPGCICPKLDNDDRLGVASRVITVGCPIHD